MPKNERLRPKRICSSVGEAISQQTPSTGRTWFGEGDEMIICAGGLAIPQRLCRHGAKHRALIDWYCDDRLHRISYALRQHSEDLLQSLICRA